MPSLDLAIAEAKSVGRQLAGGDFGTVELSAADRVSADRALTILKPLGVPLELCASEYVDARTRRGKVSLSQAVDSYLKRHPANLVSKKAGAVMEEMLELKKSDGLSAGYLRHLRDDLEKFATRFHSNIDMVMGPEIDKWLRGLGVSPHTRNNLRNPVQTLFAFAKSQKHLPKDRDEIDGVTRVKDGAGEIESLVRAINAARRSAWAKVNKIGTEALAAAEDRATKRRTEEREKRARVWRGEQRCRGVRKRRRKRVGHHSRGSTTRYGTPSFPTAWRRHRMSPKFRWKPEIRRK